MCPFVINGAIYFGGDSAGFMIRVEECSGPFRGAGFTNLSASCWGSRAFRLTYHIRYTATTDHQLELCATSHLGFFNLGSSSF